jgi:hypothetical protein
MKGILDKFFILARENDVLAKSMCLFLAVFFWFMVYNSKSSEIRFRVPVKSLYLQSDAVVSYISPSFITVVLEGKEEDLRNIKSQSIKAFVNLKKAKLGDLKRYKIQIDKKLLPENVQISPAPDYIKIKVEKVIAKIVPVKHFISGKVKDGAFIGKIRLIPDHVQIKGAKSIVSRIKVLQTEDISVEGKDGDLFTKVNIKRDNIENLTLSENQVEAIVSIINYESLQKITVPVVIRNRKKGYTFSLKQQKINLYLKTNGKAITKDDLEAYIDLRTFEKYPNGNDTVVIKQKVMFMQKGKANKAGVILVKPEFLIIKISKK